MKIYKENERIKLIGLECVRNVDVNAHLTNSMSITVTTIDTPIAAETNLGQYK